MEGPHAVTADLATRPAAADVEGVVMECFAMHPQPPRIIPARTERSWMNRVYGRHAYRCLPMTIANSYGWEILSPFDFEVRWTGGIGLPDLTLHLLEAGGPELLARFAHFGQSNFGHGIATFHPGYLFRTPPGWQILTSGPMNDPKHGVAALAGVIETDWLPYPFTMNWKLTRPGTVRFARDEPFCLVFPVRTGDVEQVTPLVMNLAQDPELARQNAAWRDSRAEFRKREHEGVYIPPKEAWQRFYFNGAGPDGAAVPITHQRKLRAAEPFDARDRPASGTAPDQA